jgi:DNA-binding response OmpR family regulator
MSTAVSPRRLLLVEDDAELSGRLTARLVAGGFAVDHAFDGETAAATQ